MACLEFYVHDGYQALLPNKRLGNVERDVRGTLGWVFAFAGLQTSGGNYQLLRLKFFKCRRLSGSKAILYDLDYTDG